MTKLWQKIRDLWGHLDAKVRNGVLTYLVGFVVTKLAIPLDPILEQAINGAIAYLVSYVTPNAGTDLRAHDDDLAAEIASEGISSA